MRLSIEDEIKREFDTEVVVDKERGLVELVMHTPHELTGMYPTLQHIMSTQTLIKGGGRMEGNRGIIPMKIGEFHGAPIPSLRFLIFAEVKIQEDRVKIVEKGIGGVKSVLAMFNAGASEVEVEKRGTGRNEVHTYTAYFPALNRVVIGIDDTDTSTKGDTYLTALKIGRYIESEGYGTYAKVNITLNYPLNPFKTTNNVSSAMVFHVKPSQKAKLIEEAIHKAQELSNSRETGMAIWEGMEVPPQLKRYTKRCKAKMLQVSDAEAAAKATGARLVSISDGDRGKIGALSSLGYLNDPATSMAPSFRFRTLMKIGNLYVKIKDLFSS